MSSEDDVNRLAQCVHKPQVYCPRTESSISLENVRQTELLTQEESHEPGDLEFSTSSIETSTRARPLSMRQFYHRDNKVSIYLFIYLQGPWRSCVAKGDKVGSNLSIHSEPVWPSGMALGW